MNAPHDFRTMTADTIGKDLLGALLSEIKLLPDLWQKMSKAKQDDVIGALGVGWGAGMTTRANSIHYAKVCIAQSRHHDSEAA